MLGVYRQQTPIITRDKSMRHRCGRALRTRRADAIKLSRDGASIRAEQEPALTTFHLAM
jgi:hypothetical protein